MLKESISTMARNHPQENEKRNYEKIEDKTLNEQSSISFKPDTDSIDGNTNDKNNETHSEINSELDMKWTQPLVRSEDFESRESAPEHLNIFVKEFRKKGPEKYDIKTHLVKGIELGVGDNK